MKTTKNAGKNEVIMPPCPAITRWYAVPGAIQDRGYIVVEMAGEKKGLLTFDIFNAFNPSEPWCTLHVIGDDSGSSCANYGSSQIKMSDDLQKQIVRMVLAVLANAVADGLAEDRSEIPEFGAYVTAEGLSDGQYEGESLDNSLIPWLEEIAEGNHKNAKELFIPQLKRLSAEAKKVFGGNSDNEKPETFGR